MHDLGQFSVVRPSVAVAPQKCRAGVQAVGLVRIQIVNEGFFREFLDDKPFSSCVRKLHGYDSSPSGIWPPPRGPSVSVSYLQFRPLHHASLSRIARLRWLLLEWPAHRPVSYERARYSRAIPEYPFPAAKRAAAIARLLYKSMIGPLLPELVSSR